MTVAELIAKLELVEDKSRTVIVEDPYGDADDIYELEEVADRQGVAELKLHIGTRLASDEDED